MNVYILSTIRYYQFANIGEFLKHAEIRDVILVKVEFVKTYKLIEYLDCSNQW